MRPEPMTARPSVLRSMMFSPGTAPAVDPVQRWMLPGAAGGYC